MSRPASSQQQPADQDARLARSIIISGRVQGVGYRPFVYRIAHQLELRGTVRNGSGKVYIHAEGSQPNLDRFEQQLISAAPPLARPRLESSGPAQPVPADEFLILASESAQAVENHMPPDLFTCDDCVSELHQPGDYRYQYPFINCTQCGPRYTIITAMPYDRPNTSMAGFPLCDVCRKEYSSPLDRRFHAQPLACSNCGPQLELCRQGTHIRDTAKALQATVSALKEGEIIAVKGVGGYHLMCDASNHLAVTILRQRKRRPDKPLAVMFPIHGDDSLDAVRQVVHLSEPEATAITDPARPIVLARKRAASPLSPDLAPGLNELGVFLPYSPLHHLLLTSMDRPLVATSGNITGEPVLTDNQEATNRLAAIADGFLHHNRPIVRPADDPVIRSIASQPRHVRLGRGIAPLELDLPTGPAQPVLAVGGHMKDAVALCWDKRLVISPHIGDLDSPRSMDVFEHTIRDLQALYEVQAQSIICDLHPAYTSSRWARQQNLPILEVQHHRAHASALTGEHPDIHRWLVFAWDGVGMGDDGSLWGGEALTGAPGDWQRKASFRPLHLSGGDKAGREPWRSAAALMWGAGYDWLPPVNGVELARDGWRKRLNTHASSAVGRLFDAAAALVLDRTVASFEGQGPMELESLTRQRATPISLPLAMDTEGILRSDWSVLPAMLSDQTRSAAERVDIFHESMAQTLVDQALAIQKTTAFDAVGLSGGVFQNRRLTEIVVDLLGQHDIPVRLHQQIPANDGGLCYGQIIEALALQRAIKH